MFHSQVADFLVMRQQLNLNPDLPDQRTYYRFRCLRYTAEPVCICFARTSVSPRKGFRCGSYHLSELFLFEKDTMLTLTDFCKVC